MCILFIKFGKEKIFYKIVVNVGKDLRVIEVMWVYVWVVVVEGGVL